MSGAGCDKVNEACVMRSFVEPLTKEMLPQKVRKKTKAVANRGPRLTSDTSDNSNCDVSNVSIPSIHGGSVALTAVRCVCDGPYVETRAGVRSGESALLRVLFVGDERR